MQINPGGLPDTKDVIESLRDILKLLAEDHYINSVRINEEIGYEFRWPLVKKWWKETRL